MIFGERNVVLAFPGLAGDEAVRHAGGLGQGADQRGDQVRRRHALTRNGLEGGDDQRVAGEKGQRLAIGDVNRGLAAAGIGIVETGQVVMDERGAMQQFDRGRGRLGRLGVFVAAGHGDRKAQARADARAAREHRIAQGGGDPRRLAARGGMPDSRFEGALDPLVHVHLVHVHRHPPDRRRFRQFTKTEKTVN